MIGGQRARRLFVIGALATLGAATLPSPADGSPSVHLRAVPKSLTLASVRLPPAPGVQVGKIAVLKVSPASSTLESGKTMSVYLTIRNKSAESLLVEGASVRKPDFISVKGRGKRIGVPPGRVGVLALEVEASERVSPGERELIFLVPVRVGDGELVDLVGSERLQVGVVGETALLTVLRVPSLLLIPGFLFLATIMLLWQLRLFRPAWDDSRFRLKPTQAEFWVIAIGASIAILAIAQHVDTSLGLFDTYGIEDLIRLWVGSFLLGLATYACIVAVRRLRHRRRVLTEDDSPIQALRKLGRARLDLVRPRRRCSIGTDELVLYALERGAEEREVTWMAPAIVCSIPEGGEDNESMRRLRKSLDERAGARTVARLAIRGQRRKQVEVRWSPDAQPVGGPRQVSVADVRDDLSEQCLVEAEA